MISIAVLVSGGGTNLQALLDAQNRGEFPHGTIACVVSSSPEAYGLVRARAAGVEGIVVRPRDFSTRQEFDQALLGELLERKIQLVVLAGYLEIVGEPLLKAYPNRIINVHPSLIPSFCGTGYYGLRVHQKALEYGVKITGATVHYVNEVVDGGGILLQKAVEVREDDSPETLQRRVMEEAEWQLLPKAVALLTKTMDQERSREA